MDGRPYAIVPFDKGSKSYRVKRYRERAELLRDIAADLVARECRDVLIRVANTYQAMAAHELSPSH
jgi:hypothetical protein